MKGKPILFSTPMVKALLNTKPNAWPPEPIDPSKPHKRQTRMVITRIKGFGPITEFGESTTPGYKYHFRDKHLRWNDVREIEPLGLPGDILWVRETFAKNTDRVGEKRDVFEKDYLYKADGNGYSPPVKWRSPLFMPHDAARIKLEVKSVRIEWLQDIKSDDVKAEGWPKSYTSWGVEIKYVGPYCESCSYSTSENKVCSTDYCYEQTCFSAFWNKLNAKRGYGWKSNPWVWVYEFMRLT
jgi:hypothetical protein